MTFVATAWGLGRVAFAALGALLVLGGALEGVNWCAFLVLRQRLEPMYAISAQLKKGMYRNEVAEIVAKLSVPSLSKHSFADGITIATQYSLLDVCYTVIAFRDGKLESSSTHDWDGPEVPCPNAPAAIR